MLPPATTNHHRRLPPSPYPLTLYSFKLVYSEIRGLDSTLCAEDETYLVMCVSPFYGTEIPLSLW